MKDQYAGDVGDYVKLALLRALSIGRKLGVAWYLTPHEHEKNDGRHVGYLDHQREKLWRPLDPKLYDQLRQIVHDGRRKVSALEQGLIEGDVRYYSRLLLSPSERSDWFEKLKTSFEDRDFVFVDPDNGIEPAGYKPGRKKSIKSVTLAEIEALVRPQRPLLVYHHQTRFPGGHEQEIEHIGEKLRKLRPGCICAIRARMWSPRVFFLVAPTREMWRRAEDFVGLWSRHVTFHPILGPPDDLGLPPNSPYSERARLAEENMVDRFEAGELNHLFKDPKYWRGAS